MRELMARAFGAFPESHFKRPLVRAAKEATRMTQDTGYALLLLPELFAELAAAVHHQMADHPGPAGGALGGVACGEDFHDATSPRACLQRGLEHLHNSQAGLAPTASFRKLPETLVIFARQELFALREAILKLMEQFQGRCCPEQKSPALSRRALGQWLVHCYRRSRKMRSTYHIISATSANSSSAAAT